MPKLPFLKLYFDDVRHEVALLPPALRWNYLELAWACFQQGGRIPDDDRILARLAGVERTKGWTDKIAMLRGTMAEENGFLRLLWVDQQVRDAQKSRKSAEDEAAQYVLPLPDTENRSTRPRRDPLALKTETIEHAKNLLPGLDIYSIIEEWRQFSARQGEPVRNADRAFSAYAWNRAKRRRGRA